MKKKKKLTDKYLTQEIINKQNKKNIIILNLVVKKK
jgi:hypothetical protein